MTPEQFAKLKVAPGSKFFKVEKGEIYFLIEKGAWIRIARIEGGYYQQLISAVGQKEWYERLNTMDIFDKNYSNDYIEATEQISLWKGLEE